MKINRINSIYVNNVYGKKSNHKTVGEKKQNRDSVRISEVGRKLSQIEKLEGKDREKMVEKVKEDIKNGTYKIDSKAIAEKILKHINKEEV